PYRSPLAPLETASKAAEPHAAPTNASDASGGPDHAPDATGVQVVQDAVNQTPPADTPRQDVEVQTSRRGANRTMAERDWSEVGRQPIAGRVAQGSPPSTSPTPSPEATEPDEATPPGAPAAEKPTA
ncbi:MAG TPA: hypothetical protein PK095_16790, partial [Myxococcota bacterium]|nr:hypothetical protein [Myxococcota bacterium]